MIHFTYSPTPCLGSGPCRPYVKLLLSGEKNEKSFCCFQGLEVPRSLKSANKSISGGGKKPTAKPREVLEEQNKPSASAALRRSAAQMPGNTLSNSLMLQNSRWWKRSNLLPPSSQQRCIKGSSSPLATQFREPKWPRASDHLPLLILVCRISSLNQTLETQMYVVG